VDERRALMAAVIANPDEDTPRLALADWLQENGDEHERARAECIRLQIRAERLPPSAERKRADSDARKLARTHRKAWLAPLLALGIDENDLGLDGFERGLLSDVIITRRQFNRAAVRDGLPDALAAVGVQELCFFQSVPDVAAVATFPGMRWVAGLEYHGVTNEGLAMFARSAECANLSSILFGQLKATDDGLRAFAKNTRTARLRELFLMTNDRGSPLRGNFTWAGAVSVLESKRLPVLDSLGVIGLPAKFGTSTFLAHPALRKLRTLDLYAKVRIADLIASPNLLNLHELVVENTDATNGDVDALVACPNLPNLKEFELGFEARPSKASEKKLKARFGTGMKVCWDS
jgi:uncharacterized protein (TIGR02996 family)